jgi:hypothetical protein
MFALKLQMPVNHPEESTWHSEHSKSSKSRKATYSLIYFLQLKHDYITVGDCTYYNEAISCPTKCNNVTFFTSVMGTGHTRLSVYYTIKTNQTTILFNLSQAECTVQPVSSCMFIWTFQLLSKNLQCACNHVHLLAQTVHVFEIFLI